MGISFIILEDFSSLASKTCKRKTCLKRKGKNVVQSIATITLKLGRMLLFTDFPIQTKTEKGKLIVQFFYVLNKWNNYDNIEYILCSMGLIKKRSMLCIIVSYKPIVKT